MAGTGVLLTTFGEPRGLEDMSGYIASLWGTSASEDQVGAVQRRYLTIGGTSPAPEMSESIAAELERRLNELPEVPQAPESNEVDIPGLAVGSVTPPRSGATLPVVVGSLHGSTSIAQAIAGLVERDIDTVVWAPLSQLEPPTDLMAYREALDATAAQHSGLTLREVTTAHLYSAVIMQSVEACKAALDELPPKARQLVVFVARIAGTTGPEAEDYAHRVQETAEAVATAVNLGEAEAGGAAGLGDLEAFGGSAQGIAWTLAYASAEGATAQADRPSLDETIDAAFGSYNAVCFCPIGFATEDATTKFTIDVLAAGRALDGDLEYSRARISDDISAQVDALEQAVRPEL